MARGRITVDEVKTALDEIGYRLKACITLDTHRGLCCPIGAIFAKQRMDVGEDLPPVSDFDEIACSAGFDIRYASAFAEGFDCVHTLGYPTSFSDQIAAYNDGLMIRETLLDATS